MSNYYAADSDPVVTDAHTHAIAKQFSGGEIIPAPIDGTRFYILWVEGSPRPSRVVFTDPAVAQKAATVFCRRIKRPVHVMGVISTHEVQPALVDVTSY